MLKFAFVRKFEEILRGSRQRNHPFSPVKAHPQGQGSPEQKQILLEGIPADAGGQQEGGDGKLPSERESIRPALLLPRWPFYLADAFLLGSALLLVILLPGRLSFSIGLYCLAMVCLAGWFSYLPYHLELQDRVRWRQPADLPKWTLTTETGPRARRYLIHMHLPRFIMEVVQDDIGDLRLRPVWIDESAETTSDALAYLRREAEEYFEGYLKDASGEGGEQLA